MTSKTKGEEFRTITVCIDDYRDGIPAGRFYASALPEGKSFRGLTQFLLDIEQFLDNIMFPKSFHEMRRFAPAAPDTALPVSGAPLRPGESATFAIRILFRQNASWQGRITWLEGKQEQVFRSALELILLIDNALNYAKVC